MATTSGMNREQVGVVLATAAAIDPRLAARDPETAELRVTGWWHILAEVPLPFALDYVRRFYSEPRDFPMQPAEVLQTWRERQREQRAAARTPQDAEEQLTLDGGAARPSMIAWLREAWVATSEGRSPSSVQIPMGGPFNRTSDAERRIRQCTYPDICACSHTECRDGWLDAETTRTTDVGASTVAVQRCPHCKDALLMAEERGIAKRPKGVGRQRRP